MNDKSGVIGISGATSGGKTTITKWLKTIFPSATIFNQDFYYFPVDDKRHILCESLGHINWEVVTAFDNSQLCKDLKNSRVSYNRQSVQEAAKHILKNQERIFDKNFILPVKEHLNPEVTEIFHPFRNIPIAFVEGITIFNDPELAELCNLKFFISLDFETCQARRRLRTYDPPDVEGYFEQVVWPSFLQIQEEVKLKHKDCVVFFDGRNHLEELLKNILKAILQHLAQH